MAPKEAKDNKTPVLEDLIDNPKTEASLQLEKFKVESQDITVFNKPLTQNEIISRITGEDRTKGSFLSFVFVYHANKSKFSVLDFRCGMSQNIFARRNTIEDIANLTGVKTITIKCLSDIESVKLLMKEMKIGKE